MTQPVFPPLLSGHPAKAGEDPFERAQAMAALGCDARNRGLLQYSGGSSARCDCIRARGAIAGCDGDAAALCGWVPERAGRTGPTRGRGALWVGMG